MPDWVLACISEEMRKDLLGTQIRLDSDGRLREVKTNRKIFDGEHEMEINEHHQKQDPPTERGTAQRSPLTR